VDLTVQYETAKNTKLRKEMWE